MKRIHLFFAIALTAVVSCSKENQGQSQESGLVDKSFEVVTTKSSLDVTGKKVQWEADDEVAVWDGTAVRKFTVTPGSISEDKTSCSLEGQVQSGSTSFTALYPYENATFEGGRFSYSIPSVQTVSESMTVGDAAMPCIAVTKGSTLSFENAFALVKVVVPEGVSLVELHSLAEDEYLSGLCSGADAKTAELVKGETYVILKNEDGASRTCFVAVAPGTLNGMRIFFRDGDGDKYRESSKVLTFARSKGDFALDLTNAEGFNTCTLITDKKEMKAVACASSPITSAIANHEIVDADHPQYEHCFVGADIDLNNENWNCRPGTNLKFYGQFHKIYNIKGFRATNCIGLFAYVKGSGKVENLYIGTKDGKNYDGNSVFDYNYNYSADTWIYIGSLSGSIEGTATVTNVKNFAKVLVSGGKLKARVGGLAGKWTSTGNMKDCTNFGETYHNGASTYGTNQDHSVGGCIGIVDGKANLTNIEHRGYVHSSLPNCRDIAGVIGYSTSAATFTKCNNYGRVYYANVSGMGTHCVGGVVSRNATQAATFKDCHNYGEVLNECPSSGRIDLGGLVACSSVATKLENCSNEGPLTNNAECVSGLNIGGIIAYQDTQKYKEGEVEKIAVYSLFQLTGCTNTGKITNTGAVTGEKKIAAIGGIIANMDRTGDKYGDNDVFFDTCINSGAISNTAAAPNGYFGGVLGVGNRDYNLFKDCENHASLSNTGVVSISTMIGSFGGYFGRGKVESFITDSGVVVNGTSCKPSWIGDNVAEAFDWISPKTSTRFDSKIFTYTINAK